ncbi:hypothetical protein O0L34_g13779 [Tuta absoluta]|nr:hypothetical protein O0L34_g13779 [Tuta absoluta]
MFKIILSVFCLFLLQQGVQSVCPPGKCCIPNVGSFDGNGQLISDPNGICQQYACFDGGYSIYQCPQYGEKCSTVPGIPGALFPDCCLQLDAKADQTGCTAVA